jgi:hypothetical protein
MKNRYGLKRLSKEENKRLKMRTEERIEIARAKENYWKKYRDQGDKDMKEEEKEAWVHVEKGILMFEEDGSWINEDRRITKEEIADDSIPDAEDGGRDELRQEEGGEVIRRIARNGAKDSIPDEEGRGRDDLRQRKEENSGG